MLTGYCDRLSAAPGTAITVHVSTDAPFVDVELVRLTGSASGPGRPFELPVQRIEGTRQRVAACTAAVGAGRVVRVRRA